MIPSQGEQVKVITENGFKEGICEVPRPETTEEDYEPESLIEIDSGKMWYSHDNIYDSGMSLEELIIQGEIGFQRYRELVDQEEWDTDSDICDNTDCKGDEDDEVKKVLLTENWEGHIVEWCQSCIGMDYHMVDEVLN